MQRRLTHYRIELVSTNVVESSVPGVGVASMCELHHGRGTEGLPDPDARSCAGESVTCEILMLTKATPGFDL
jgi:hypothetical protein